MTRLGRTTFSIVAMSLAAGVACTAFTDFDGLQPYPLEAGAFDEDASWSSGGSEGNGGAGGEASGDGGQGGDGGTSGTGGSGGSASNSGGTEGNGGDPGSGGGLGAGGDLGAGGAAGSGGDPGGGGSPSDGGAPGSGGITGNGGTLGNGGAVGNGGAPSNGGAPGSGGAPGNGGRATGGGCASPRNWYLDSDQDGYGVTASLQIACAAPGSDWVQVPGDCNDDDDRVHPGQATYFPAGYDVGGSQVSFDYDCSNAEDGDPTQSQVVRTACAVALCSGNSYLLTSRSGAGVNRLCGSDAFLTCTPDVLILCKSGTAAAPTKRCR